MTHSRHLNLEIHFLIPFEFKIWGLEWPPFWFINEHHLYLNHLDTILYFLYLLAHMRYLGRFLFSNSKLSLQFSICCCRKWKHCLDKVSLTSSIQIFTGILDVISSNLSFTQSHVRFKTVSFKPFAEQRRLMFFLFISLKLITFNCDLSVSDLRI